MLIPPKSDRRLRVLKADPLSAEARLEDLECDLTRSADFYVRNHGSIPELDARTHHVWIGGAVERTLDLSLDDLRGLPSREVLTTLECAGNGRTRMVPVPPGEPWGLGAVSTARWTGVSLCDVLTRAGVHRDALEILTLGADRGTPPDGPGEIPFARSLPIAKAMDPDTLLAFEMNGEPLPREHGAPVRLIVPGWYGVASVKWVARIEALTEPFAGYYQVFRYNYHYDVARPAAVTAIRIRSLITSPREGEPVPPGPVLVRGKAWSGEGEVVRVEVAVDAGPWREARLSPGASPYVWRSWELPVEVEGPGLHVIRARAEDAKGNRQPGIARWNRFGYGNNAVQAVAIHVL